MQVADVADWHCCSCKQPPPQTLTPDWLTAPRAAGFPFGLWTVRWREAHDETSLRLL